MLLVDTALRPSAIHGVGVFARRPIAKDALVWKFSQPWDLQLAPRDVLSLRASVLRDVARHLYLSRQSGCYVLCRDNARFMNHSRSPNLKCTADSGSEECVCFASRSIAPGEELTCDYREFDAETLEPYL